MVFSQDLPGDYLQKSIRIKTGLKRIELRALLPLDIVVTKIGRLNERDLQDIEACIRKFGLKKAQMAKRASQVRYAGNEAAYDVNLGSVLRRFFGKEERA